MTTDLVAKIVEDGGGRSKDVLTGFKYIAEQMAILEGPKGEEEYFLFGCEESFGYLAMPSVRDKDAVSSAWLLSSDELCIKARSESTGSTDQIYDEHGFYTEVIIAEDYEGAAGKAKIAKSWPILAPLMLAMHLLVQRL